MSQVLTVPTHFGDIAELSQGFLDRVEQDTLILYGPVPYEDGSEIDFAILLSDGSAAIEGRGRVRAAVDGGDERMPETRYDVVLESLQLDGRYEVIFESLVLARQAVSDRPSAPDDDPAEGFPEHGADDPAGFPASDSDSINLEDPDQEESEETDELVEASNTEVEEEAIDPRGPEETETAIDSLEPEETETAIDSLEPEETDAVVESLSPDEMSVAIESLSPEELSVEIESLSPDALEDAIESLSPGEAEPGLPSSSLDESNVVVESSSVDPAEPLASDTAEPDRIIAGGSVDWDEQSEWVDEPSIHATLDEGEPSTAVGDAESAEAPEVAKPPSEPPSPPEISLERAPDGLTRPSRVQAPGSDQPPSHAEEAEPSQATGLFQYEESLPIPSRPPLPDLDPARRVSTVDAIDSEPPELEFSEDEADEEEEDYEEVLLAEPDDPER